MSTALTPVKTSSRPPSPTGSAYSTPTDPEEELKQGTKLTEGIAFTAGATTAATTDAHTEGLEADDSPGTVIVKKGEEKKEAPKLEEQKRKESAHATVQDMAAGFEEIAEDVKAPKAGLSKERQEEIDKLKDIARPKPISTPASPVKSQKKGRDKSKRKNHRRERGFIERANNFRWCTTAEYERRRGLIITSTTTF